MNYSLKNGSWVADTNQEQGETQMPITTARTAVTPAPDTEAPELSSVVEIEKTASDTVRRVVRTFIQAFTATLTVSLPTILTTTDTSVLLSSLESVGVSAVLAGATASVALLHNILENLGTVPNTK